MTIQEIIEQLAATIPEQTAVVFNGQSLTFAELNQLANQRAVLLIREGISEQEVVALYANRSIDIVPNILAVLKARAICAPISPDNPEERLIHILEETKATAVIGRQEQLDKIPLARTIRRIPEDSKGIKGASAAALLSNALPSDIYAITYSSGSEGRPKGIPNNQEAILKWLTPLKTLGFTSSPCRVVIHPHITFDAGLWDIFRGLLTGASIYLIDETTQKSSGLLINFINEHHITDITLPAPITKLIDPSKIQHPVRFVSTGSAFIPTIINGFLEHKHRLFNGYGPTEVGIGATLTEITKVAKEGVPIGNPIPGMTFQFKEETKAGEIKFYKPAPGAEGELYIGGPGITPGYLNNPERSKEVLVRHNGETLYKTGDIIRLGKNGEYYLVSRVSRSVKINGQLVNLDTVETVALSPLTSIDPDSSKPKAANDSTLAQAAAISRKDRVICYFTLKKDALGMPLPTPMLREIRKHFALKVQGYEAPSQFVALEEMPLTANGKIDYIKLANSPFIKPLRTGLPAPTDPKNPLEENLYKRCLKLLEIEEEDLGVKDNLSEIGLPSLYIMGLITSIENDYGVEIDFNDFIKKYNTIETLAAYIRYKMTIAPTDDLRIKKGPLEEDKPLVWCFHDATGKTDAYKSACDIITDKVLMGCEVRPVPKIDRSSAPETKEIKLTTEPGLCQTLEDMAIYWIEVIRSRQPTGPYELVGYSFGASLAQKVAYMLQQQGEIVSSLYLIDAVSPKTLQDFPNDEHAEYLHKVVGLLLAILNTRYTPFYTTHCEVTPGDLQRLTNSNQVRRIFHGIKINEASEKEIEPNKPRRLKLEGELEIIKTNLLAPFLEGEPTSKVTEPCCTQVYYTQELVKTFANSHFLSFGWDDLCEGIWMKPVKADHRTIMADHRTIMRDYANSWAKHVQGKTSPPGPIPTSPSESKSPSRSKNLFATDFQLAQPAMANNLQQIELKLQQMLREEQEKKAEEQRKKQAEEQKKRKEKRKEIRNAKKETLILLERQMQQLAELTHKVQSIENHLVRVPTPPSTPQVGYRSISPTTAPRREAVNLTAPATYSGSRENTLPLTSSQSPPTAPGEAANLAAPATYSGSRENTLPLTSSESPPTAPGEAANLAAPATYSGSRENTLPLTSSQSPPTAPGEAANLAAPATYSGSRENTLPLTSSQSPPTAPGEAANLTAPATHSFFRGDRQLLPSPQRDGQESTNAMPLSNNI